jgi:DNA-binding MarR family transcriptional regulator
MATPKISLERALPVFLRPGRGVYGLLIREALLDEGFTDMPAGGAYVLVLLEPRDRGLSEVIDDLTISKQRASQLVDTLVVRGYVDRTVDEADRRRMILSLTERGHHAAAVVFRTVVDIDRRLVEVVGEERMTHTKETLAALLELWPPPEWAHDHDHDHHHDHDH